MERSFCDQHRSTLFRHHSADFLEARIGLSTTTTKTGLVCEEGRTRSAIQLDFLTGTSKATSWKAPSASISALAAGYALTTISMGTFRLWPIRARSMSQEGFWSSGRWRIAFASADG